MPQENQTKSPAVTPPVPDSIEETGLSSSAIEQLLLKTLFFRGDLLGRDLGNCLGLSFGVINGLLEGLKQQHFVQVKRSQGMGNITALFALSEAGRNLTRDYLENNQYFGPAPVPIFQYSAVIREQKLKEGWLTPEALQKAYSGMVVTPRTLSQIGPAVSSGNSFLIYGDPGNGKTFLAEALFNLDNAPVYVPYAIECQGTITQVFDPIYHQRVEDDEAGSVFTLETSYDRRWVKCRRPFIVSGGELTMNMLDLSYNPVSKIYDAPFQLKANSGIYLIDDLGRSRATPAEILNRWIVPMERRIDYLTFMTGGKMTVPFETFLIFSTNLNPAQLGDEAFLRRIQYKMYLRSPDEEEFTTIFERYCASKKLPFHEGAVQRLLNKHYRPAGKPMRRCHPRDLLSHAINLIHFEKRPFELTDSLVDRAFESCFVEDVQDRPRTLQMEIVA